MREGCGWLGNLNVLRSIVAGTAPFPLPTLDRLPTAAQAKRLREAASPCLQPARVADLLEWPPYPLAEREEMGMSPQNVGAALRLFGCFAAFAEAA